MIKFDHIEVHVKNSLNYTIFLEKLMGDGKSKKISENDTYMFVSSDNIHIEVKQNTNFVRSFDIKNDIGFCMPCLRMKGAFDHLRSIDGIEIINQIENPDGACYFFKDYEGIIWHFKDYDIQDKYINI